MARLFLSFAAALCSVASAFVAPNQARATSQLHATWSDSKAVKDYQDFLSSGKQEIELTIDVPSVIVTDSPDNELAQALFAMGGGSDVMCTPDTELPMEMGGSAEYPVYITLPPWQIDYFLANLGESYKQRPEDFVFFSGGLKYGNIEDDLKNRGYCRDTMTQVLISGMRMTGFENRVEDVRVRLDSDSAIGEEKWAGECAACGKWAGSIEDRLARSEVTCSTDFYREWRRKMWERSTFDAVFNLLGVVRSQETSLSQVAEYYETDASDMLWEMSQLLKGWKALTLLFGFEDRMFTIAEKRGQEVPSQLVSEMYPYIWGNKVFLESKMFCDYLNYAQEEKGLLQGIELPQKSDEEFGSKMRQGNLRADGAV